MVTKEPAQYIGDEAARAVPGRPVPSAALGYAGALLAAAALLGLVFAARLPLGVTDREALPESTVERRSDPRAPKECPCPQL